MSAPTLKSFETESNVAESANPSEMESNETDNAAGSHVVTAATRVRTPGTIAKLEDDPTLPIASSMVRFRVNNSASRVYQDYKGQFIIEETFDQAGNHRVKAKSLNTRNTSLMALRACYTLVVLFFTGFLFVFCVELLLYVVLDLTIEIGVTSKGSFHPATAIGSILALPLYIHGLACSLVIALQFAEDTWTGHPLVKRFLFGRFNNVLAEWIGLFGFIIVPLMVLVITTLARLENWWELTTITWFGCVFLAYLAFAIAIVAFENKACWEVTRNRFDDDDDSWPEVVKRAILLRLRHYYGGTAHTTYFVQGSVDADVRVATRENAMLESHRETRSLYSQLVSHEWLSTNGGLGLFEELETPFRIYTIADINGDRPYVTADSWSLESIYCRPKDARYVAVLKGPQALTKEQIQSSMVCAILGQSTSILILAGLLNWFGLSGLVVLILVLLFIAIVVYPNTRNSYRLYQFTKDLMMAKEGESSNQRDQEENVEADTAEIPAEDEGGAEDIAGSISGDMNEMGKEEPETARDPVFVLENDESEGVYQVWESYRVINVTERMCWIFFGLEIAFLFCWPLGALYAIGNYATASLFFFVAIFSGLRTYLNAATIIEETGTLSLVDGEEGTRAFWHNCSRLNTIVTKITRSPVRRTCVGILSFFLVTFLMLFGVAVTQEGDTSTSLTFKYAPDFEYIHPNNSLMYPTCTLRGLEGLGNGTTYLADFLFLAQLAYRDPSITQNELNQWFGNNTAIDKQDFVDDYRNRTDGFESPVSYKMIVFPKSDNLAMVTIRGTTNAWDAFTDAQLWAAAGLFQFLRLMLPIGAIWTPIIHRLVDAVSWLASDSISRVAFYRETTAFVDYLKTNHSDAFPTVQITGHSLGGGLSIITGAQTGTAAVALSGPNALLSRDSFYPPITKEALDMHTFNVIPERDIVPRFDDKAKLNQAIRCTAPLNDVIGCHDARRSLCEIIYSCGTGMRPALCDCVYRFDYPEPTPKPGVEISFAEACAGLIDSRK